MTVTGIPSSRKLLSPQSRSLIQVASLVGMLDLPVPCSVTVSSTGGIDIQVLERGEDVDRWATFDYLAGAIGGTPFVSSIAWPTVHGELAGFPVHVYAPMLAPKLDTARVCQAVAS